MIRTQFARLMTTAGIALAATFVSVVWPLVFYALVAAAAVIGAIVLAAATYDWIISASVDLELYRADQDRRHGRTIG